MKNYRTIDLFCGGGALSQGLANAGFDVVAAFDNWAPAIDFYNRNITSHQAYNQDLKNIDDSIAIVRKWKPDVIAGGPPCQDFSSAGNRDESGGRADLTFAYAKIVSAVQPRIFIMENVDRAVNARTYRSAIQILKDAGYEICISVLDASLCGVPQRRKRAVAIGMLERDPNALVDIFKSLQSDHPMTLREFFGQKLGTDYYYRHPRSYARRGIFSVDEPSPTIRGVNRPIPKGYHGHKGDPVPVTHKGLRPLTTKERSLIQTFPEEWDLSGSKSDIEQIIGNAVPVNLACFIGKAIIQLHEKRIESYKSDMDSSSRQLMFVFVQRENYEVSRTRVPPRDFMTVC
jgi:DNA (cytosine-5)-methyltransferase 1